MSIICSEKNLTEIHSNVGERESARFAEEGVPILNTRVERLLRIFGCSVIT